MKKIYFIFLVSVILSGCAATYIGRKYNESGIQGERIFSGGIMSKRSGVITVLKTGDQATSKTLTSDLATTTYQEESDDKMAKAIMDAVAPFIKK